MVRRLSLNRMRFKEWHNSVYQGGQVIYWW